MHPQLLVHDDSNSFLEYVVSKLVRDKPLHDLVHTELLVPRLRSKLAEKHLVVPVVRAFEHLVNLECRLVRLEALLDDV